jgi:hypothetical protein
METIIANDVRRTASDLDAQLARFRARQAELSHIQERVIAATQQSVSPAILLGQMLAGYAAFVGVGFAIGVLL